MKMFAQHKATSSHRPRPSLLPVLCTMLVWMGALAPCGSVCGASTSVASTKMTGSMQSAELQIYLYDAQGHPVNVTTTTYYVEPHVYDLNNNLIGTVGSNGVIYNSANQNIGYVGLPDDIIQR